MGGHFVKSRSERIKLNVKSSCVPLRRQRSNNKFLETLTRLFLLQVMEWVSNEKANASLGHLFSLPLQTPRSGPTPVTGFTASNLQEFDFSVESYLGSAYWEASKFLDRLQQVN